MYTCRECETEINQATEVCPHCGADLTLPVGEEGERKKLSLWQVLLRWALLVAVLLGALYSFLVFVVSPRAGRTELQAETQALTAMDDVRGALMQYATSQGAYPQLLEDLGPPAREAAQLAQSQGYMLAYAPAPPDADGAIHSYSLTARAGNYSYRSFYSDASGIVRSTRDDRDANALDPPVR